MNAETVVRNFCAAFANQDVQELLGYFAEGAIYHNIPLEPSVGLEAIETTLGMFISADSKGEFEIVHLAVNGQAVLTERIDHLTVQGKAISLPVMGTFEVDEAGKITAWRDYFDMAQLMKAMG